MNCYIRPWQNLNNNPLHLLCQRVGGMQRFLPIQGNVQVNKAVRPRMPHSNRVAIQYPVNFLYPGFDPLGSPGGGGIQ